MTVLSTPSTTIHPARHGTRAITAQDLWSIPRVGAPEPAHDGSACVVPVTTYDLEKNVGRSRLWWVPVDGGAPRPLTSAERSSGEPALSPDGRWLAFTRKDDAAPDGKPGPGAAKAQLYLMPMNGGEPRRLTEMPLGAFDPAWMPDGSGIVFGAYLFKGHLTVEATKAEIERRDKDPVKAHITEDRLYRYWDQWLTTGEVPHLFLYEVATDSIRDLTPDSTIWFDWMEPGGSYDVSPDGREIAWSGVFWDTTRGLARNGVFVAPLAGGAPTCITQDHPANDFSPRYSPDGRSIVYGMTHDPQFYADRTRLMVYDRASRAHREASPDWPHSPADWTFAADGTLWLTAEEAARMPLYAWRGAGAPEPVVTFGSSNGVACAGGKVFFVRQTLAAPCEAYVWEGRGEPLRLTRFTDDASAAFGHGEVREMQFEGAYGENVQMFVVLPPGFETGKQYPLVQVIHGGPHGISGDVWHYRWNPHLFASPGYVVAMVNFQGSTSWGQDFAQRIQGGWGDRPYQDVMKATDALLATGIVDEKRMAAAGGSYGGYMAAWIAGHTDRFRCIVNHAGVYNLLSQYASDWTQGRNKAMGGEPWEGLEEIERWSPARYASGFKTPMLVIHGERDYRVPVTQGLECYGVLKAKGVDARLVYFPDENHWILKPRNSMLWYDEVVGWLKRFLGA
jgi:dipeptidyl aminopeptidase/acylaminoacyl peptidase